MLNLKVTEHVCNVLLLEMHAPGDPGRLDVLRDSIDPAIVGGFGCYGFVVVPFTAYGVDNVEQLVESAVELFGADNVEVSWGPLARNRALSATGEFLCQLDVEDDYFLKAS